jgi:hypothetical protein
MVHIRLPVNLDVGEFGSSAIRNGVTLGYKDTPVILETPVGDKLQLFRSLFQYRYGNGLEVVISDISGCIQMFHQIFETRMFVSDMSIQLSLKDHCSYAFGIELSKSLGIRAIDTNVSITTDTFLHGIAQSFVNAFSSSSVLPRYLVEQFMYESPSRFPTGSNSSFESIPFELGDTLSFYLTLQFQDAIIHDRGILLSDIMSTDQIPTVSFVIRFSFSS